MDTFVQLTLVGLTTGTLYGIVALGFSLIFTSSSILNFAQGDFVMVGGVSAAVVYAATGSYALAFIVALLAGVAVSSLVYYGAVRPLLSKGSSPIIIVLATLAGSIVISAVAQHLFGPNARHLPPLLGEGSVNFLGAVIGRQELLVVGLAIPLVFVLWLVLYRTRVGLDIRAVGVDRGAAQLLGVETRRITLTGFMVSGLLGALAGVLLTPILGATPTMSLDYAVTGFIAAVVGGISNPFSALVGGVFVGLLEIYVSGYVSSSFTEAAVFILLPLVLLLRPDGLFVPKVVRKR
ncbi:MAG: branched-chain amino acid ABC transporter permease [Paeniglutamicibacter sp.]